MRATQALSVEFTAKRAGRARVSLFGTRRHVTPEECREARALIGWSKKDLAEAAVVSPSTLHRFESKGAFPNGGLLRDIRQALEAAGVEFILENGSGPGVRLRKAAGL